MIKYLSIAMMVLSCSDNDLVDVNSGQEPLPYLLDPPRTVGNTSPQSNPSWNEMSIDGAPPSLTDDVGIFQYGTFMIWGKAIVGAYEYNGGLFSVETDNWTEISQIGAPATKPTGIAVVDDGYLVGTIGGIYHLSKDGSIWNQIKDFPLANAARLIGCGDYVVSLAASEAGFDSYYRLNGTEDWQTVQSDGHPSIVAGSQVVCGDDDTLVVFDGLEDSGSLSLYYPGTNRWRKSAPLPSSGWIGSIIGSSQTSGFVMVASTLYAQKSTIWKYDVVTNGWTPGTLESSISYSWPALGETIVSPFSCKSSNVCTFDSGRRFKASNLGNPESLVLLDAPAARISFKLFADDFTSQIIMFGGCEVDTDAKFEVKCKSIPRSGNYLKLDDVE